VGEKLRFLDLFAGIGGFRLGLEQAGHECIGFCEIDKFARQAYKANFNTEGEVEWHDITKVTDGQVGELRGKVDLITGGFPCQAFSVAGKRRGFEDTRGTLFFEIARLAKILKPRYLLLENVKGLLNHARGTLFSPYSIRWGNWGIGWNGNYLTAKISECPKTESEFSLLDILEENPEEKYFLSQEQVDKLKIELPGR
jgi:site-specific DNA-cytosine methylase